MKRIFLLLAAVAAFASCVKENDLVPDQPETQADNIVTLKATSSDTKAVLNGADVLWYGKETVAVVLQKSGSPAYNIELTANVDEAIKNATFTGEISEEAKNDTGLEETGWAVYPNTAVPDPWDGFLHYTLPETQNGTDIAHISSARVNTADIQAGAANASFNNFLTLLKITVPEGVNEVSLTANYGIVGTANLNKPDAEGKLSVNSYSSKKTVTLSTDSELDPETVYSVLVFPGTAETLTLSMTGNDSNDVYESTLHSVELRPGTYRTIDLTEVFAMGVQAGAEIEISSVGGEHVISVADVTGDTYTVNESADWLEAEVLETRSFSGKEIVLTAGANLTGSSRSTDVTISWSDQSRTFTVSQEGISSDYLEFVYVDPADPENSELIQWSESFKIYANADDATAEVSVKKERSGQFTIDFTEGEECEFGMYKITGLFFTDRYFSSTKGYPTNQGGIYYADYNPANKELTVYNANAEMSYNIAANVVLKYDKVNQSFSISDPVSFTANGNSYEYNQAGVIYNYEATVYVAPDPGAGGGDPIAGEWTITAGYISNNPSNSPTISIVGDKMVISGSEGNYTIDIIGDVEYNLSLTLSGSNLVSTPSYNDAPVLTLVYDSGTNTLTQSGDFMDYMKYPLSGLVATKQGGSVTVDNIVGDTWVQDWAANSGLSKTMKVSIAKIDDTHVSISNMFDYVTISSATFDPSAMTLTVPAGWSHPHGMPGENPELVFNVSNDFNTLTLTGQYSIGGYMSVTDYVLTR